MLKIGLTGGIGSGKSTISNMLKNKGIKVIDADVISRQVLEKYTEIIDEIGKSFGSEFINEEGKLKRREFGRKIFEDEKKRKAYENIIIPFIKKEIYSEIKLLEEAKELLCVLDAPTLIEHGLHKEMDYNILVWVDDKTQLKRVMKRDSLTKEDAGIRINSQIPLEQKKQQVNYIIDNSLDVVSSKRQLERILQEISSIIRG